MITSYKYRIYPNQKQVAILLEQFETCRRLWNSCLAERKYTWKNQYKSISSVTQMQNITLNKKTNLFMRNVYIHILQDVVKRLEKAYKKFFIKQNELPKFKKYGNYNSITYPDAYNGSVKIGINKKKIYLSKIGYVPIVVHRDPPIGKNKCCTVKREGTEWYVCMEYEVPDIIPSIKPIQHPVGIDLGLKSIITTSDNIIIKPTKPLQQNLKHLKHLQRNLSRKKKGSKNRIKAIHTYNKQSRKIARIRADINHKLSYQIANTYDFVSMEKLNIQQMQQNHYLAQSIQDVSWGQLSQFINYKVTRKGHQFVQVSPEYTSQTCSLCKHTQPMPLHIRIYNCPVCGNTIDRDINASRNILEKGWLQVGKGIPELMSVENRVQPNRTIDLASPFREAETILRGE
jgi:putative transposase